jgi:hypothetical protein
LLFRGHKRSICIIAEFRGKFKRMVIIIIGQWWRGYVEWK